MGYSESDTFGNFSPPMPALLRDAADQVLEFYTSAAVQYPLAADAYYAFPAMLNGESGPVDIQFAASRDGAKWVRPDRRPIIHTGFDQAGNDIPYEKGSLYAGYGLTRKGDEVALYYTTLASLHVIPPPHSGIITRAIYRVDGFTSVNAADTPGQFSTGPLLFEGDRLELNCKTRTGGWLKVVILDKQGSPISGLTSDPITGDSVAMSITFGGSPDLSRLRGKPVQLRFLMCNADLYAFQVAISEPTK